MKYQVKQNKGLQAIFSDDKQITKWSEEYFILDEDYFIELKDGKCAIFSFDNQSKPLTQSYDLIIPALYSNDIYIAIEDETKPLDLTVCSIKEGKLYDVSLPVNIDTTKYHLIDLIPNILYANDSLLIANISILRPELYYFCYSDGRIVANKDDFISSSETKPLIAKYITKNIIPIITLKHAYIYSVDGKLLHDIYLSDDIKDIELAIEQIV